METTMIDEDEIGTPCSDNDATARNVRQIRSIHSGESVYMSTSQAIMVGLALCRPDLLEKANYPASDIKGAWERLDDSQRAAIPIWWKA